MRLVDGGRGEQRPADRPLEQLGVIVVDPPQHHVDEQGADDQAPQAMAYQPGAGHQRLPPGRTVPSSPPRMVATRTGMPSPRASTMRPGPVTIATCRRLGPSDG